MSLFKNTYKFIEESTLEELTEKLESYGIIFKDHVLSEDLGEEFNLYLKTTLHSFERYEAFEENKFYYEQFEEKVNCFRFDKSDNRPKAA